MPSREECIKDMVQRHYVPSKDAQSMLERGSLDVVVPAAFILILWSGILIIYSFIK